MNKLKSTWYRKYRIIRGSNGLYYAQSWFILFPFWLSASDIEGIAFGFDSAERAEDWLSDYFSKKVSKSVVKTY